MRYTAVIGGSGFIGTRLIELLGKENCYNIDKNPSDKFNWITTIKDIRDPNLEQVFLEETKTIVLLAAEHRDDVSPHSLYYEVNVNGTRNVLEAMDRRGITDIIFISSAAVYGLDKNNPDETFPPDPFSQYGKSKWMAEKVLQEWFKKDTETKSLTIVRPSVAFGENNKGNVHNLLRQIASGNFLMVGKGRNSKSMAYVSNVAAFIKFCLENSKRGVAIYNYTDKPDLTMNELIVQVEESLTRKLPPIRLPYWLGLIGGYCFDLLTRLTGKKFPINSIRIKKFCATTQYDASKAHNTGFVAPYTLAEGLDITLKSEFGKAGKTEGLEDWENETEKRERENRKMRK